MWVFELINFACAVIAVLVLGYAVTWLAAGLADAIRDILKGMK